MKNISTKSWTKIIGVLIILFFLIYPFFQNLIEANDDKLLEDAIETKGVIVKIHTPKVIHGSYYGVFSYSVNNKNYSFDERGDFSLLNLKDTVLIIYSKKDHSVARVKDKYYLEKYKHLKR
jgi:hypothetical protein